MAFNFTDKLVNDGNCTLIVDALNLAGPTKVLSGKIYLIRYQNDGTLLRRNLKISSNANL